MTTSDLLCLLFPDVWAHEREGVKSLLEGLGREIRVKCVDSEVHLNTALLSQPDATGAYWIVAKDWQRALSVLATRRTRRPVFVSVLNVATRRSFSDILRQNFRPLVPFGVQVLAHSPINFRFFREIAGIHANRVQYLPFPIGPLPELLTSRKRPDVVKVGCFADFKSESNLHYLLNVAHCVHNGLPEGQKNQVKFLILGTGPLRSHLERARTALALDECVEIRETPWLASVRELDIYLHTSLQSGHFMSLCAAGQSRLPVVASDVPGIGDLITHGESGFISAVNDTRPMAQSVLQLLADPQRARSIGENFYKKVNNHFSAEALTIPYRSLFVRGKSAKQMEETTVTPKAG